LVVAISSPEPTIEPAIIIPGPSWRRVAPSVRGASTAVADVPKPLWRRHEDDPPLCSFLMLDRLSIAPCEFLPTAQTQSFDPAQEGPFCAQEVYTGFEHFGQRFLGSRTRSR
jgi:hypothetical protein